MYEFLEYKVRDFMTLSGIVVGLQDSLATAETFLERHDYNLLPVVERRRLVGVLTKTDLLKAFAFDTMSVMPAYAEITSQVVGKFMTTDPEVFSPDAPLTRVLERMVATRHRSFPVVEGEDLVGIISREDVVKALRQAESRRSSNPAA